MQVVGVVRIGDLKVAMSKSNFARVQNGALVEHSAGVFPVEVVSGSKPRGVRQNRHDMELVWQGPNSRPGVAVIVDEGVGVWGWGVAPQRGVIRVGGGVG